MLCVLFSFSIRNQTLILLRKSERKEFCRSHIGSPPELQFPLSFAYTLTIHVCSAFGL